RPGAKPACTPGAGASHRLWTPGWMFSSTAVVVAISMRVYWVRESTQACSVPEQGPLACGHCTTSMTTPDHTGAEDRARRSALAQAAGMCVGNGLNVIGTSRKQDWHGPGRSPYACASGRLRPAFLG